MLTENYSEHVLTMPGGMKLRIPASGISAEIAYRMEQAAHREHDEQVLSMPPHSPMFFESAEAMLSPGQAQIPAPHQQTRLGSVIETCASTAAGFILSLTVQHFLYPVYGFEPSLATNIELTTIFTVLSLARGYVTRRIFTRIKGLHK